MRLTTTPRTTLRRPRTTSTGKEDLSHLNKDNVLRCFVENSQDPRKALQAIVRLVYYREGSQKVPRRFPVSFFIDEHGAAWVCEKHVRAAGQPIPIYHEMPKASLVSTVCFTGISIMYDAYRNNKAPVYVLPAMQELMEEEAVDKYGDFIRDAVSTRRSTYMDDNLVAFKEQILDETEKSIALSVG